MSIATLPANIYAALSGYAGLQALLAESTSPITYRVYPLQRGFVGNDPFLMYELISDTPFNILEDCTGGGKRQVRIQLASFSETSVTAYNVAEQARLAMAAATTFVSSYQNTTDTFYDDVKLYSVITQYLVITT